MPLDRVRAVGVAVVALLVAVALIAWAVVAFDGDDQARSVIFVNGDGMGAAQRQAATLAQEGFGGTLAMDALTIRGSQSTDPDDPVDAVTDSAAAASAWATGQKTSNGRVSTTPDGEWLTPLGRQASEAGKATGLVTTSYVTDASPAAFFASVPDRGDEEEIAQQYLDVGLDVVLGGGAAQWSGELRGQAERSGYELVEAPDALAQSDGSRLLGLFAERSMYAAADEGERTKEGDPAAYDPAVSLADMTTKALDVLSQDEDGFFLFVEEEGIDSMGHRNNGTLLLESMQALDDAVEVARAYVEDHPDTLLVVTGDHEAGGLTIEDADESVEDGPFDIADSDRQFSLDWTTGGHTGVPTPVTAQGPGSEELAGHYENTHVYSVLRNALLGS